MRDLPKIVVIEGICLTFGTCLFRASRYDRSAIIEIALGRV